MAANKNILVIGGTRYVGIHLIRNLLALEYNVTIATRGQTGDSFGDRINRILIERTDENSIRKALDGAYYDIVYDNLAYCSDDVKYLLEHVSCGRYIQTSSVSVYPIIKPDLKEEEFDPFTHPLTWYSRQTAPYNVIKQQAECAIFQAYSHIPATAVRFPCIFGADDYTRRIYFYVDHIVKSTPMLIDNMEEYMPMIHSEEAGRFLSQLAEISFAGTINAASKGAATLSDLIRYVEEKTGKRAIITQKGEPAPFNGSPSYSINTAKAESIGFVFSDLDKWLYPLLDTYIEEASS